MKKIAKPTAPILRWGSYALLSSFIVITSGCHKFLNHEKLEEFTQVNLVSNNKAFAPAHQDKALVNAWGLAFSAGGTAWVNANGWGTSNVYDKDGKIVIPPVAIPSPTGSTGGTPTGIVFYGGNNFKLSNKQPARFIFVAEDGVLSGWNPGAGGKALLIRKNGSNAVFKGLAMAARGTDTFLYAANFKANHIDVWDKNFNAVSLSFKDPGIPSGFAPFNIQNIDGKLYVTYAKVGPDGDDVAGAGNGYVDIYNTNGSFVKRFASKGTLNSPWGLTKAPGGFFNDPDEAGGLGGTTDIVSGLSTQLKPAILIGNFGDGRINVFDLDGTFLGQLKSLNNPITIEGLWALSFPPATATSIDPRRLYFTAGPNDEKDGLFGYLIKH